MFPVRLRERLMDLAYPAWFMWCASSLLDGLFIRGTCAESLFTLKHMAVLKTTSRYAGLHGAKSCRKQ